MLYEKLSHLFHVPCPPTTTFSIHANLTQLTPIPRSKPSRQGLCHTPPPTQITRKQIISIRSEHTEGSFQSSRRLWLLWSACGPADKRDFSFGCESWHLGAWKDWARARGFGSWLLGVVMAVSVIKIVGIGERLTGCLRELGQWVVGTG